MFDTTSSRAKTTHFTFAALALACLVAAFVCEPSSDPPRRSESDSAIEAVDRSTALVRAWDSSTGRGIVGTSTPSRALFGAPIGTRLVFDYRAESRFTPDVEREPLGPAVVYVADLVIDIVGREEGRVSMAVRFDDADIPSADETSIGDPLLRGELEAMGSRFLVEIEPTGGIRSYRFSDELGGARRNLLRSLFAAFAFTVPAELPSSWEAPGADGTGSYVARYTRQADDSTRVQVWREKVRYESFSEAFDARPAHELTGGARATLDRDLGWLREAEVDESLTIALPLGLGRARATFRGRESLREVLATPADESDVDDLLAQEPSPAGGEGEEVTLTEEERLAALRRDLEGLSSDERLADVVRLVSTGAFDSPELGQAMFELALLLEVDPSLPDTLRAMIVTGEVAEDVAGMLLSALGAAGNEACQQVLLDVLDNELLTDRVRDAAAAATFQLREPDGRLVQVLARRLETSTLTESVDSTTMLALGALASRSGDGAALEALLALENRAQELGATELWLDALGNTGSGRATERVVGYLDRAEEHVRIAALTALRSTVADGKVAAVVKERALTDPSSHVRAEAVNLLGRSDAPEAHEAVELALLDESTEVRRSAVLALGRRRDEAASRERLSQVAREDPSNEIREFAGELLTDVSTGLPHGPADPPPGAGSSY